MANKAVSFISEKANKTYLFFMYFCSQAGHLPHTPTTVLYCKNIVGTTPSKHMDMIKELDVQFGTMLDQLKKQGVYDNTVFIFASERWWTA